MTDRPIDIARVEMNPGIVRAPFVPRIRVARITEYLLCFYDGRELDGYPDWLRTNIDMQLGLCCYVLHRGEKAIIFDTMLYKEQMIWIDRHIREMGIRSITVINSHWDCDHIAGNFLYRDCDIIATDTTRWSIEMYADAMRSGEIWAINGDPNYPGIEEVVLPNRTFSGEMTLYLEDIRIELREIFAHQLGSLVAYLPDDKILLAADACEDSVLFINQGSELYLPIQIMTYRKLLTLDIDRVLPSHGRFDVISAGGYGKDFLRAMMAYQTRLVQRLRDTDYLDGDLESYIGDWVEKGVLAIHEPYRWLHGYNLQAMRRCYAQMPAPAIPR